MPRLVGGNIDFLYCSLSVQISTDLDSGYMLASLDLKFHAMEILQTAMEFRLAFLRAVCIQFFTCFVVCLCMYVCP